jgi:hypothetical protein
MMDEMKAHLLVYMPALNTIVLDEIKEACKASNVMGYTTIFLEQPSYSGLRLQPIQISNPTNTVHIFATVIKNNDPASVYWDAEVLETTHVLKSSLKAIIDRILT